MLEVYMRSGSGVSGLSAAELAVSFLPDDPETYYQLDNAAFELGLIDPFLARSLTWLARQKLEDGEHEECRRLLNMYLRIRPDSSDPVVTQGHINAIDESTSPDLLPAIPDRVVRLPRRNKTAPSQ
jgi:hypothetical protein